MRVLPRSLRGQVLLAVLATLYVAQMLGFVLWVTARDHAVRDIRLNQAIDSAAALLLELDTTPPALRRPLLRAAESPLTQYRIDAAPSVAVSTPRLVRYLDRLQDALLAPDAPDGRIRIEPDAWTHLRVPPHGDDNAGLPQRKRDFRRRAAERGGAADLLQLALPLADGHWLNADVRMPMGDRGRPGQLRLPLLISAIALGVVVWLVLSRLLGPLQRLAQATEALGRGDAAPLPVKGPAEMRALTEAFNQMQQRLNKLVEGRTQMLAALGHDLRSPITALRLRVEMLENDEDRARMAASLDEMQGMVEQTLAYARGVWTAEAVEDVDLSALIGDIILEMRQTGCRVDWQGASVLPMRLRPVALRRALRNLIDNACRYGGQAAVVLETDADTARIQVHDRGPGLSEDDLKRVMDPFVRVEGSRSRETGGSGLGLAIARGVAQAHGGGISLANRDGGGLCATLYLPRPALDGEGKAGRKRRKG